MTSQYFTIASPNSLGSNRTSRGSASFTRASFAWQEVLCIDPGSKGSREPRPLRRLHCTEGGATGAVQGRFRDGSGGPHDGGAVHPEEFPVGFGSLFGVGCGFGVSLFFPPHDFSGGRYAGCSRRWETDGIVSAQLEHHVGVLLG